LTVTTTGGVGIGTTSPNQPIDVQYPGSSLHAYLGNPYNGGSNQLSYAGLGVGTSGVASNSNYVILSDGTNTWVNAPGSGGTVTFRSNANGSTGMYENGSGNIIIGPSADGGTAVGALTVLGDIDQSASAYHNFGATDGSGGYGFRDSSGTMQEKNSGGAWAAIKTTNYASMAGNTNALTPAISTTTYWPANGSLPALKTSYADAITMSLVSRAATVQNLYYRDSGTKGGVGATHTNTITVQKNNVAQTLTCTVVNTTTTCNDTTHSFSVVAGDQLTITIATGSASTLTSGSWSIELSY
jgi:hypothetical protein